MGTEDFIAFPASGDSENENENNESLESSKTREVDSQSNVLKCESDNVYLEKVELEDDVHFEVERCLPEPDLNNETQPCDSDMEIEDLNNLPDLNCRSGSENKETPNVACKSFEKKLVNNSSFLQTGDQLTVRSSVSIEFNGFNSGVRIENGQPMSHSGNPIKDQKSDAISGVKRPRMAIDEQQPSVHVVYSSLTRASKQKLDDLLKQWSEWHAQRDSLSQDDKESENLETGEETVFPAICVGTKKTSAVAFWIDNQLEHQQNIIPFEDNSVPLYDRGFTLGLTSADDDLSNSEGGQKIIGDASRCFNCGSYNHSLKDCRKPRDNVAVKNARKKYQRHLNSGPRNVTRYYQNSQGGKYDDLSPGALNSETRQLLGLKELDPPPWLNRMRELGYPPGYLDADEEDQPSGITIYSDEKPKEQEDGEIIEGEYHEPRRKMSVGFPGINSPIPEDADEKLWAAIEPSSSDLSRSQSHRRSNHYAEHDGRGSDRYQQSSRDSRDERPPGVDSINNSHGYHISRYGGYDFNYDSPGSRGNFTIPRSSDRGYFTIPRSSDRGDFTLPRSSNRSRRSSLFDDDNSRYDYHSSSLFSPPRRH